MNTHGFSLIEVLVSLLLMSSISLTLLKQQWHVTQSFNQITARLESQIETDNQSERLTP